MGRPLGYRKNFVKHPETKKWVDPGTLSQEQKTQILQEQMKKDLKKRKRRKKNEVEIQEEQVATKLPPPPEMTEETIKQISQDSREWKDSFSKNKGKVKDELGPQAKSVKNHSEHPSVIISWKDKRNRLRTTEYVMAELSINEAITETFNGSKKQVHIHLSLDGMVFEKN